jgi:hypothetical protein
MNMTEAEKRELESLVAAGAEVSSVVYNPSTVVGDPEAIAAAAGWVEFQREDTPQLVEVIYTR